MGVKYYVRMLHMMCTAQGGHLLDFRECFPVFEEAGDNILMKGRNC